MPPGELLCPIDGNTVEGRDDLKVHLHVSHRKSLIVEALLEVAQNTSICPIDGEPIPARTDMKAHLHVSHRKSELVDTLLDADIDTDESEGEESEQAEPLTV
jgi:hypothetical protein